MAVKVSKALKTFSPDCALIAGSFVPNGTSDPTSYTDTGSGVTDVTYNAATGKWLVTINVDHASIVSVIAAAEDNAAQTVSFEVRVATRTNGTSFEVWGQSSSDVSATNYAATNTIDRINWVAVLNLTDVAGNGT